MLAGRLATLSDLVRFRTPVGARVVLGRVSEESFDLPGKEPSVLCLHGFCGVPVEMKDAIDAAVALGLRVRAPRLPGHGGDPERLRELRYGDWYEAARMALQELAANGPVVVVGMSMGSLLAAELALEFPESVAGLGVMANAVWVDELLIESAIRVVKWLRVPDFGFPVQRSHHPLTGQTVYNVQPVHAAMSVVDAAHALRPRLHRIACPTLVLHGARDRLCPVSNAWQFARSLGTTDAEVIILPKTDHMIPYGRETAIVRRNVRAFLARLARSGESPDARFGVADQEQQKMQAFVAARHPPRVDCRASASD